MEDLVGFVACFSGDGNPYDTGCGVFDVEPDGDVDAEVAVEEIACTANLSGALSRLRMVPKDSPTFESRGLQLA